LPHLFGCYGSGRYTILPLDPGLPHVVPVLPGDVRDLVPTLPGGYDSPYIATFVGGYVIPTRYSPTGTVYRFPITALYNTFTHGCWTCYRFVEHLWTRYPTLRCCYRYTGVVFPDTVLALQFWYSPARTLDVQYWTD